MSNYREEGDWIHFVDFYGIKISHNINPDRKCTCVMCMKARTPYNIIEHWNKCKCAKCQQRVKDLKEKYYGQNNQDST